MTRPTFLQPNSTAGATPYRRVALGDIKNVKTPGGNNNLNSTMKPKVQQAAKQTSSMAGTAPWWTLETEIETCSKPKQPMKGARCSFNP